MHGLPDLLARAAARYGSRPAVGGVGEAPIDYTELDARSAVVALTHDPKLDDLGLMEALRTEAFYVGALGSRRNNDARRQRLLEFELSAEQIARLRGPVGLRLGALTPPEIVVSILAEMTALRRGVSVPDGMVDWGGSTTQCRTAAHP